MESTLKVGTSGWQYRDWRGRFYETGVPQIRWLEYYAERFTTVEINNTFYRLPRPETFEQWRRRTPDGFCFVVKASRYLTHIKRLREPAEPVARLMEGAHRLGPKLGAILVQLPPDLEAVPDRLAETLARFPKEVRVAVEFRHESWFSDAVRDLLTEHGAALVLSDRRSRVLAPLWKTAPWLYLRLHEGTATPRPCYGDDALRAWVERLSDVYGTGAGGFVFFNNDHIACAVENAVSFRQMAERRGFCAM